MKYLILSIIISACGVARPMEDSKYLRGQVLTCGSYDIIIKDRWYKNYLVEWTRDGQLASAEFATEKYLNKIESGETQCE